MSGQAELVFVRNIAATLAAQPTLFADDFQQAPEQRLRRVNVLQVPVPAPPARTAPEQASTSSTISVTFKQLKPPFSVTLAVHPADAIAAIKDAIAASASNAPPAATQRLLLKGKALADGKLLKDYSIHSGDTVNIMSKPSPSAATTTTTPELAAPQPVPGGASLALPTPETTAAAGKRRGHGRIPSVVLSPSPSPSDGAGEEVKDIPLVDVNGVTTLSAEPAAEPGPPETSYRATVADPAYWERLYAFIGSQFSGRADAHTAFEDYLNASKGALTASEIAKIRDTLGITGMGGA